ncbi:hypothetical protein ACIQPQ_26495 [Streptomyces sp. NPDC091281]|uniref:hypothetical protein n=1 Tax=Streptomyces sp. NPDC091281 TaxID=3365985 RepID=UPI0037F9D8B5
MEQTSAAWAAAQLAAVHDDPLGRIALLSRTYGGPLGRAPRHLPFRRAAMSFMRWQAGRGVLNPLESGSPGSPWWRAVNDRLLLDGCEAVARSGGLPGAPSSPSAALWSEFVRNPTSRTWYRAHNASIVSGYLEHRDLAAEESRTERFFLNVTLLRVLYAHALVAAPRLALGRFSFLGGPLGDPRLGMTGVFLSLGRVLPDRYPSGKDLEFHLADEHRIARVIDYGVIRPRLQPLYEWSAREIGIPRLVDLVREGNPVYVWEYADREVWSPRGPLLPVRVLRRLTAPPR